MLKIKVNQLNKKLNSLLLDVIKQKTRCYYNHAQVDTQAWNDSRIALFIYKDYNYFLNVTFKNKGGTYSSVGVSKVYNIKDINNIYFDMVEYVQNPTNQKTIHNELVKLMQNHLQVLINYDIKQFNDALFYGDFETLQELTLDNDFECYL